MILSKKFLNRIEKIDNKEEKQKVAFEMAKRVKNGEIIGFGSGTTSFLTVIEIAKRIENEKLDIKAIPSSNEIEELCNKVNIKTISLLEAKPNWCFDGADEVDENQWLIKGMGAAMFREKLNIINSSENYILIDQSKKVKKLGEKHPIPVECYYLSLNYVKQELENLGAQSTKVRVDKDNKIIVTDNGNIIIDAKFENIDKDLEIRIKQITGVIESGLFIGYNIVIKE